MQTLPFTGCNLTAFSHHGAAALGIIMMKESSAEGPGIAPYTKGFVVSQWRPDGTPNEADALLSAIFYLHAGDILLLETQSFAAHTGSRLWPLEIQDAVFATIRLATALGIIVVEPAGNGNVDGSAGNSLDHFSMQQKKILNPLNNDYRDSGAILVAAATSTVPHYRTSATNYGKRINCYAWGEAVTSAGNYPHTGGNSTNAYTHQFSGTSAASAIIAGACLCVQSILKAHARPLLSPAVMRNIFSDARFATASACGIAKDKIGVMPDLKKIIGHLLMHNAG